MAVLIALVLLICGVLFVFSVRSQPLIQTAKGNKSVLVLSILIALTTCGVYRLSMFDERQFKWYDTRKALLSDIRDLLETDTASPTIQQLDAKTMMSALGYYAQRFPKDERVWQKLAVILISLEIPDQALQALRRYLFFKPDDHQARALEVQLLTRLIDDQAGISPRQLRYAIQRLAGHTEVSVDQRFQLAGLAYQYHFFALAADLWQSILDQDQRPDTNISADIEQGRRLLRQLIAKAQQETENARGESQPSKAQANKTLALPSYTVGLQWSPEARKAAQAYMQATPELPLRRLHIWLSIKPLAANNGPPLAAQLVWIDQLSQLDADIKVRFDQSHLMLPDRIWQLGDQLLARAYVVLSPNKTDPLQAAQQAQMRAQGDFLLDTPDTLINIEVLTTVINNSNQQQ